MAKNKTATKEKVKESQLSTKRRVVGFAIYISVLIVLTLIFMAQIGLIGSQQNLENQIRVNELKLEQQQQSQLLEQQKQENLAKEYELMQNSMSEQNSIIPTEQENNLNEQSTSNIDENTSYNTNNEGTNNQDNVENTGNTYNQNTSNMNNE